MECFKHILSKNYLSIAGVQFSRGVKRKYPINPDHVNELPGKINNYYRDIIWYVHSVSVW